MVTTSDQYVTATFCTPDKANARIISASYMLLPRAYRIYDNTRPVTKVRQYLSAV